MSERYGAPEVVRVLDGVPLPWVGSDDVLVRVHATTVNRTDCGYRGASPFFIRGISGVRRPRVDVWGTEFAGVVERVGREVTRFAPGDEVFGYAEGRFGAHAEYVAVSVTSLVAPVPDGVDLPTAAAATEGGHYALSSIRRAGIRPGQRVLVHGATGAIGSAACSCSPTSASTSSRRLRRRTSSSCGRLGAEHVIDHETTTSPAPDETSTPCSTWSARARSGRAGASSCRGGVYVSSDLGPFAQNVALPLVPKVGKARGAAWSSRSRWRRRRCSSTCGRASRAAPTGR